jgi:YfiH family protein
MPEPLVLVKEKGSYRIPLFEKSGLRALFTTRYFNMAFEGGGRSAAYKALGLNGGKLVCSSQVHSARVFVVEKKHGGRGAHRRATAIKNNDALVTATPGIPIAVLTADCLPVVLWAPDARAAAVVHVGWRGAQKKIIAKTLGRMAKKFDVKPEGVMAAFGPSIRSCCYEVGREFLGHFPGGVREKQGKLYFDIIAEADRQLAALGVRPDRVYDSGICTCCAKNEFTSYRREGASAGRSMAVAEILGKVVNGVQAVKAVKAKRDSWVTPVSHILTPWTRPRTSLTA